MAYNITLSNGEALVTVADGTVDVNYTSLSLIGKNFAGYGALMNANFVYLLENFSNAAPPTNPLTGQLWYDASNRLMKVYTANGTWKTISSATASMGAPPNPAVGDQWFDTYREQLYIWAGAPSNWKLIGPLFTVQEGITGAVPDVITDTSSVSHVVIKFYVNDIVAGIWSKDTAYAPDLTEDLPGFTGNINPGLTLADLDPLMQTLHGTADNALSLGDHLAEVYPRMDQTELQLFVGPIALDNATEALRLGGHVTVTDNNTYDIGTNSYKFGSIYATTFHGKADSALEADNALSLGNHLAATYPRLDQSSVQSFVGPVAFSNATEAIRAGGNITVSSNNVYDIGTSGSKFSSVWATTFHGTATTAQFADLAERFEADAEYAPGTVVALGGAKEITKVNEELSDDVFGVISTKAAYLMNAGAGTDATHPPIAVSGRVPVQVIGKVKKNDRLVSAGNGLARAATKAEITPWNVIGRALSEKTDNGVGTVEAIVKLSS